jgi:hypothetical protein
MKINNNNKTNDDNNNNNNSNENEDENSENNNKEPQISSLFWTLTFTYHISKSNINIPIFFSECYPYTFSYLQSY